MADPRYAEKKEEAFGSGSDSPLAPLKGTSKPEGTKGGCEATPNPQSPLGAARPPEPPIPSDPDGMRDEIKRLRRANEELQMTLDLAAKASEILKKTGAPTSPPSPTPRRQRWSAPWPIGIR